jgi:four helix bundle protein
VTNSPAKEKSYAFALRIVELGKHLHREKKEFVLSRQVLRSGTSIGANIEEASAGHSRKEFGAKMSVASREARETAYWLRLLRDSNYIDKSLAESLIDDCQEIIRILTAIVKSTKEKPAVH